MAKREIKREPVSAPAVDTPSNTETVEAEKPCVHVQVVDNPIPETKVADGVIRVKAPAIVIIRVLKGFCLYQEGVNFRRMPIDKDKPVEITIKQ